MEKYPLVREKKKGRKKKNDSQQKSFLKVQILASFTFSDKILLKHTDLDQFKLL